MSPFVQGTQLANPLLFSEIRHPTLHRVLIRTPRNLYRRICGEADLTPKNPPFDA
jgi:hypothetical protein